MYVVTFYSFKGGVGRTMALVNVAADLARRGRKVLIVDFDLEAPGITSYDFCSINREAPGIVDYVEEYSNTLTAPDVGKFVTTCALDVEKKITVHVMPAGNQDNVYRRRFQSINWANLYSEQAGYLMMEDLKEQWRQLINPDYVLIDSRTGHTDVSGICTRQLPNAVVLNFFPNKQNLYGLKAVVRDIRHEQQGIRKKEIFLHFVSSNTPDADDEDGILRKNFELFKSELSYDHHTIVHYYNSLALVNQEIFTLTRPKARLAVEYRELVDAIISENAEDEDGVILYLERVRGEFRRRPAGTMASSNIANRLEEIHRLHHSNGVIMAKLGEIYDYLGRLDVALDALNQAVKAGTRTPDIYRKLANIYLQKGERNAALKMYAEILRREESQYPDVGFALRGIADVDESYMPKAMKSTAVERLKYSERCWISDELMNKVTLLPFAIDVLQNVILSSEAPDSFKDYAKTSQVLAYIGIGKFETAMELIGSRDVVLESSNISSVFNFAMAEWGLKHYPPPDLFLKVVDIHEANSNFRSDANYFQCLAISCWAIDQNQKAKEFLEKASEEIKTAHAGYIFNAWQYTRSRGKQFSLDLAEMKSMLKSGKLIPEVFRRAWASSELIH